MKYLVVSDNHGDRQCLVELVTAYRGKVDGMFHCGDSELEPTDELWHDLLVVTGNCDYYPEYQKEQVVTIGNDKILMLHGHLANVRSSLNQLLYRAEEVGATIALFGHTHELGVELVDGVLALNPGSIRLPRGRYQIKTYAIIESTDSHYDVQYYDDQQRPISELHFTFAKAK